MIAKFRLRKAHHREKVMREIAIHKELKHANVVRMYSSFEDEDNVYMVLELCKLKVGLTDRQTDRASLSLSMRTRASVSDVVHCSR